MEVTRERFVNEKFSEIQKTNRSPIDGYQHFPIMTLEETIQKVVALVPGINEYVSIAKQECNQTSSWLTHNESAAIYLYTMPIPFFEQLNKALRDEDRDALKPWFPYLKLFIAALEKLPSTIGPVWRGVSSDVGSVFGDGKLHTWWSINSCSMDLSVVKGFLGKMGTLFLIETVNGKNISQFSAFPNEKEVVLMPGTQVGAPSQPFSHENQYLLVHLKEETGQRLV